MDSQPGFRTQTGSRDEARPAIVRACDMCRKKKIRCDPTEAGCAQCTRHSTSCHFTPIATKRRPRRPAGFKYIAQLEERLLEVETLLGGKSLVAPTMPGSGSLEDQTLQTSLDTKAITNFHNENPWTLMDETRLLPFGHITHPELPVEITLQPYNKQAGFSSIGTFTNSPWPHPAQDLPLYSPPVRQQLPTKADAWELVQLFFSDYNRFLPLFDESDFLKEFHFKYSATNPRDAAWWACLNVVLSIAHRLRALHTADPVRENILARGYIENALDVVSELSVSDRSLYAVQSLVGMACILQGTPNPEPAAMLVAAALRLAQAMNLHREGSSSNLGELEAEKRRRTFWKIYVLDKDISLRTCRPFGQDDDDMDVLLPNGSKPGDMDLFNHRIGLAVIQGQVYKQLYSVRAERQSATERALAAQELASLLSYWKSTAQPESPDDSSMLPGHLAGEMVHKVVLRLTYIHCLTMIDKHLTPQYPGPLKLNRFDLVTTSPCLVESRKAIRLVETIPEGDRACVWTLLHAFFAAAKSMLYNLTQNPTSSNALADLHHVRPFLRLLDTLVKDPRTRSRSEELVQMHNVCGQLYDEAEKTIRLSISELFLE